MKTFSFVVVFVVLSVTPLAAQEQFGSLKIPDLTAYDITPPAASIGRETDRPSKLEERLYRSSQIAFATAGAWDMVTTWQGLTPYQVVYDQPDGHVAVVSVFQEGGWAKNFVNPHSRGAVVGAGIAGDAVALVLSELLYRKGGKWRTLVIAANMLFATTHARAAYSNQTILSTRRASQRAQVPAGAFNVSW